MLRGTALLLLSAAGSLAYELQSGFVVEDSAAAAAAMTATVATENWYTSPSGTARGGGDNIVGASAAIKAEATKLKAKTYNAADNVQLYSRADPAAQDLLPVKSFFSASLGDTLTTASAQGLAWAADPKNGYTPLATEGYCTSTKPSGPSMELMQYWSAARNDSFVVSVGGEHERTAKKSGYVSKWVECYVVVPPPPPPPSCRDGTDCGGTGLWTAWKDEPPTPGYSNPGTIPWPKSTDLLGWEFKSGANPGYGGGDHTAASADTWYPSWAADGNLYTPWTDGHVHDDETGKTIGSGSGRRLQEGGASGSVSASSRSTAGGSRMTTTGQAVIVGDDPFGLNITKVKTFTSSTSPYEGRYPCGSLVYKGNWWYGTYYLDNPNATVDGNYVGPNPGPNCGNWCIQGPVVDFRRSTDQGATWHEERVTAKDSRDNLFGETAQNNARVKFGAPHWVDFGQELEHSPDGKAYLVGHGATSPHSIQAWMLGDEVYMARVTPDAQSIANKSSWEYYAGGHGASAKWVTGDVGAATPLVTWDNHTGVVTMTFFPALKKYIMSISTATHYPMMTEEFDTYFLESDSVTGPWSYVTYMSKFGPEAYFVNHPSKFSAKQANTSAKVFDAFLMYSANFAFKHGSLPQNSAYHMNLQQARFPLSAAFAQKLEERYRQEATAAV